MLDHGRHLKILLASWAPFRAGAEVAAERLSVGLRDCGHDVTIVLGTKGDTLDRMRDAGLAARHVPLAFTDRCSLIKNELRRNSLYCPRSAVQNCRTGTTPSPIESVSLAT